MVKIIILKKELGKIGNIINVSKGYARNYLIPYSKALYFNKYNINKINKKKILFLKIKKKNKNKLNFIYKKIILLSPMKLYYRCSKKGKLFDSLKIFDICKIFLKKLKFKISKKNIFLPNGSIKYIGKHIIYINLFKKKKIKFIINIISIK